MERKMPYKIYLHPKFCNLCGAPVEYVSNEKVYGKKYGSGYCYLCTKCGAYVGTHKNKPRQTFGILADERMRKGKMMCHEIFDSFWKGKKRAHSKRDRLYAYLAEDLGIPNDCSHFGYFDITLLRQAYKILKIWQKNGIDWNRKVR